MLLEVVQGLAGEHFSDLAFDDIVVQLAVSLEFGVRKRNSSRGLLAMVHFRR
jgi:hypothetical protein